MTDVITLKSIMGTQLVRVNAYFFSGLPCKEATLLSFILKSYMNLEAENELWEIEGKLWVNLTVRRLETETGLTEWEFRKTKESLIRKGLLIAEQAMAMMGDNKIKISVYRFDEKALIQLHNEGEQRYREAIKTERYFNNKITKRPTKLVVSKGSGDETNDKNNPHLRNREELGSGTVRSSAIKDKKNISFNPSSSESLRDSSEEVRHHEVTFPPSSSSDTTPNKKRLLKKTNKTSSVISDKENPAPVLKKKILKKTTEKPVAETFSQLRCSDSADDEGDEESISLPSKGPRTARGRQSLLDESETILKSIPVKKKFDRAKFKGAGPGINRKFENIEVSANVQKYIDTWNDYSEGDEAVHRLDEFHRKGPTKGIEQTKKYKSVVKALKKMINGTLWKDVGKISLDEFERMIERLLDCAYDKEVFPKNKEWIQRNLHLDFALIGMMGTIQPLFLQYSLENPQIIVRHIPKNEDLADDMREQYAKLILGFKKKQWSAKEINKLNKASNDLIRFVNEHKRVLDMRYTLFDYLDWLFEAVVWYYRTKMKSDITVGHMCSPYTWETVFPQYLTEQKIMDSGL